MATMWEKQKWNSKPLLICFCICKIICFDCWVSSESWRGSEMWWGHLGRENKTQEKIGLISKPTQIFDLSFQVKSGY